MTSLVKAKAKGKFRPCRADVPKRKVLFANSLGNLEAGFFAYGEPIPGLKLLSAPAGQCAMPVPVRSGVGTAHHLRRFPVVITTTSQDHVAERLARIIGWIENKFPESKPKLENENRIRVVLWADEAKFVRENVRGNYRVRED